MTMAHGTGTWSRTMPNGWSGSLGVLEVCYGLNTGCGHGEQHSAEFVCGQGDLPAGSVTLTPRGVSQVPV